MNKSLNRMNKMDQLSLTQNDVKITEIPTPPEVILPLIGFSNKKKLKVKIGQRLITGEQIVPGIFSTVTGTVTQIDTIPFPDCDYKALRIEVEEKDEFEPKIIADPDYLKKKPADILQTLNRANLGFADKFENINTVIVSTVDPDPLSIIYGQILREYKENIAEGIKLIKYLTSAEKVFLAVSEELAGIGREATGANAEVLIVKPDYPNSLPELLARQTSEQGYPGKYAFIKAEKLVSSIIMLKEGKPAVHKMVSVINKNGTENYKVRLGTPIKVLLKDTEISDNDKVILGSPLRGAACFDLETPITADVDQIYIQDSSKVYSYENNQCINCGKCVTVCPVDLDVNLICRFAEFSVFDKCAELGVNACIECGLCAYYCPASRSLIQFIRMAKKETESLN